MLHRDSIWVARGCFGTWLKSMKNRHLAAVAVGGSAVALVGIFTPWATWERSWLGGYFSGDISAWELMLDSRPIISTYHAFYWVALAGALMCFVAGMSAVASPRARVLWASMILGAIGVMLGSLWGLFIVEVESVVPHYAGYGYGLFLTFAGGAASLVAGALGRRRLSVSSL